MDKQKLIDFRRQARELQLLEDGLVEMRAKAEALSSPVISDMPKGSSEEERNMVVELVALQEEYETFIRTNAAEQLEVEHAIAAIDDPTLRSVIRLRYIKGLQWQDIAKAVGCSEPTVYRLHRSALEHFE